MAGAGLISSAVFDMSTLKDSLPLIKRPGLKRCILHFDMNYFEGQVWEKFYDIEEMLKFKARYLITESDRVVSVNYFAKKLGINRVDTPKKADVDEITNGHGVLFLTKPNRFGKPDTLLAREAGYDIRDAVVNWLTETFPPNSYTLRVTGDEIIIDSTKYAWGILRNRRSIPLWIPQHSCLLQNTYFEGDRFQISCPRDVFEEYRQSVSFSNQGIQYGDSSVLFVGAMIANKLKNVIRRETGYQCSAGVGHNQLTAKIACGLNKPDSVTILPKDGFWRISQYTGFEKIPGFGRETGKRFSSCFPHVRTIADVAVINPMEIMRAGCSRKHAFDYVNAANGICRKKVESRPLPNPINCGKGIFGDRRIYTEGDLVQHINLLSQEIFARLSQESRRNHRDATGKFKWTIKMRAGKGRREMTFMSWHSCMARSSIRFMYLPSGERINW